MEKKETSYIMSLYKKRKYNNSKLIQISRNFNGIKDIKTNLIVLEIMKEEILIDKELEDQNNQNYQHNQNYQYNQHYKYNKNEQNILFTIKTTKSEEIDLNNSINDFRCKNNKKYLNVKIENVYNADNVDSLVLSVEILISSLKINYSSIKDLIFLNLEMFLDLFLTNSTLLSNKLEKFFILFIQQNNKIYYKRKSNYSNSSICIDKVNELMINKETYNRITNIFISEIIISNIKYKSVNIINLILVFIELIKNFNIIEMNYVFDQIIIKVLFKLEMKILLNHSLNKNNNGTEYDQNNMEAEYNKNNKESLEICKFNIFKIVEFFISKNNSYFISFIRYFNKKSKEMNIENKLDCLIIIKRILTSNLMDINLFNSDILCEILCILLNDLFESNNHILIRFGFSFLYENNNKTVDFKLNRKSYLLDSSILIFSEYFKMNYIKIFPKICDKILNISKNFYKIEQRKEALVFLIKINRMDFNIFHKCLKRYNEK